jgi:DNA-binding response OmpR family regulator
MKHPIPTRLDSADGSRSPTAVVAEDDAALRDVIVAALRADGFLVSTARDGRELLEIVRAAACEDGTPPDLIVSDVRMPSLSGLDALTELGALLRETRVLVMTAFGDAATHARARSIGAFGVLHKPFDLDALRAAVLNPPHR